MNSVFEYFQGPVTEMAGIEMHDQNCTFCGETGLCFRLEGASRGCFSCLRHGRFFFDHNTEIGHLSGAGLQRIYSGQKKAPQSFHRAAFGALLRTPQFTTWQTEEWLTHCDDFMVYLGEWKPHDFREHAIDGDARRLFMQMTDPEWAHLWEEATPAGAAEPREWYASYYAFRCRHCSALRGNWDCP